MSLFHVSVVLQVDAIVNSMGTSLELDLACETLQDECQKKGQDGVKCGEVVVTPGGQLQCQYVIHGAVCNWSDGQCKEVQNRMR